MKTLYSLIFLGFSSIIFAQVDTDSDGMPDDWEILQNLDINDPKDAFGDLDCDQVWNLYEYQMGSNPNDLSSPQSININQNTSSAELEGLITQTDGTLGLLIKLEQGIYEDFQFTWDQYIGLGDRVMVQGGWNFCTNEYDPIDNRTIFRNHESTLIETKSTMIYDGLEFDNSRLTLASTLVNSLGLFSISNCGFYNDSTGNGTSPVYVRALNNDIEFYMTNTSIVEQRREMIFIISGNGDRIKAKLLNTMITAHDRNIGITCFQASGVTGGVIDLTLQDCNIWDDNMWASVQLGGFNQFTGEMNLYVGNSNISPFVRNGGTTGETIIDPDRLNVDPRFHNRDAPYYEILANSPLEKVWPDNGLYPSNAGSFGLGHNKDFKTCVASITAVSLSGVETDSDCSVSGEPNGMIDVTVVDGALPYSYMWTTTNGTGFSTDSEDQMNLSAGTYEVVVTDASGCTASATFQIDELNPQACRADCDLVLEDSDNDGMPNDWEIANGLDECDPTDAFDDPDCDQVINLFEYQLQTGIYDETAPRIIEFTTQMNETEFSAAMDRGLVEAVCIRMQEGDYRVVYLPFETNSYRVMVQGGWDASFNRYNPFNQVTRWNMTDPNSFGIAMGGNATADYGAFIMDGICAVGDNTNSGAINLSHQAGQSYYSFYNCSFFENGHFNIELNNGHSNQIEIINCSFYDSNGISVLGAPNKDIIEIGAFGFANSNVRILNSSVFSENDEDQQIGFELRAGQNSSIRADVYNTVIWNNIDPLFQPIESPDIGGTVEVNLFNSNMAAFTLPAGGNHIVNEPDFDITFSDPQFILENGKLVSLPLQSPFRNIATDLGVFFNQPAPDLGINATVRGLEINFEVEVTPPDCGMDNGSIEVVFTGLFSPSTELEFEIDGQGFQSANVFGQLPEGNYHVRAKTNISCKIFEYDITLVCVSDCDTNLEDSDNDGMPNVWERANGLDECDPADAFGDEDCDQVYNLYEYQLATDPRNDLSPQHIFINPQNTKEEIEALLGTMDPSQAVLIKMFEGSYPLIFDWQKFLNVPTKFMVQGGWSRCTQSYDPFKNRTILNDIEVNNAFSGPILWETLIYDGIEFNNSAYVSVHTSGYYSISNCAYYGYLSTENLSPAWMRPVGPDFELTMFNCSAVLPGRALTIETRPGSFNVKAKFINCTFTSSFVQATAIQFTPRWNDGIADIFIDDCNFGENGVQSSLSLGWGTSTGGICNIYAENSNLPPIQRGGVSGVTELDSDVIDIDPVFADNNPPYFELSTNSPLQGQSKNNDYYDDTFIPAIGHNKNAKSCFVGIDTLQVFATITNSDCLINGMPNGSIELAVTGGVAPYTYEWSSSDGAVVVDQQNQTNLPEGTYTVVVTDANLCTVSESYQIVEANPQACDGCDRTLEDSDNDGMPNDWEIANLLDECDPTDAFCDPDRDQVWNLYEYQLGSNPNNNSSPRTIETDPEITSEEFTRLLALGLDEPIVIRFSTPGPGGIEYLNNILPTSDFNGRPLRVMLQGGWSEDYTEYDPFNCFTGIRGRDVNNNGSFANEVVDLLSLDIPARPSGINDAIIIDGFWITNLNMDLGLTQAHVSLSNSRIAGQLNALIPHFPLRVAFNETTAASVSTVNIIKCAIQANKNAPQISILDEDHSVKLNILNASISENLYTYALRTATVPGAEYEINVINSDLVDDRITNSILTDPTLIGNAAGGELTVNARSSNLTTSRANGHVVNENFETTLNFDPDYVFYIPIDSPLYQTGEDIGLPFAGPAPNMGMEFFTWSRATIVDHLDLTTPDCGQSNGVISFDKNTGVKEFLISRDGNGFFADPVFRNLDVGPHIFYFRSIDGCENFSYEYTFDDPCSDKDDDGIPDVWERNNGLDENDPTDAYCDYDEDKVINLFEYQLGTNPSDESTPVIRQITSSTALTEIESYIEQSETVPVVIRMSEGTYNLSLMYDVDNSPERFNFMFQGGWNSEFCDHDPFLYLTECLGTGNSGTYFFSYGGSDAVVQDEPEAFLFEGISFSNSRVRIPEYENEKRFLSIYNCSFRGGGSFYRPIGGITGQNAWDDTQFEISLINCSFSNIDYPLEFKNFSGELDLRVRNSTFSETRADSLSIFELGASFNSVDISVDNSILWDGKPVFGFIENNLSLSPKSLVNLNVRNSITEPHPLPKDPYGMLWTHEFDNLQYDDPIQELKTDGYFVLKDNSPYKSQGEINGIPHLGSAPDIGANTIAYSTGLIDSLTIEEAECDMANGSVTLFVKDLPKSLEFSKDKVIWQSSSVVEGFAKGEHIIYIRTTDNCAHFQQKVTVTENCGCDLSLIDSDNDGMPNAWEDANGLDKCDPTDAFGDEDCDQVWNLYEYQLGTDLRNPVFPVPIVVTDDMTTTELNLLLALIDIAGPAVFRFIEGTYEDFNLGEIEIPDPVMFQGGWNCSMEYDPIENRTLIRNAYDNRFEPYTTLIIDGFELEGYTNDVRIRSGFSSYSNCMFHGTASNPSSGIRADGLGNNNEFYITNCSFSSVRAACVVLSSEEVYTNCKVQLLNTTVAGIRDGFEAVLIGESLGGFFNAGWTGGTTNVYVQNSTLWDARTDLDMLSFRDPFNTDGTFNLYLDNTNLSTFSRGGMNGLTEETDLLNVDPLYASTNAPRYELSAHSPLLGLSTNRGLYDLGFSPALGHNPEFLSCFQSPNPLAFAAAVIDSDCSVSGIPNGSIDITVTGGTPPYDYEWSTLDGSGLDNNTEDQTGLSGGMYQVTVTDVTGCTEMSSYTIAEVSPQDCGPDCDLSLEDSDNDGMPNLWELANGLDPCDPTDALCDPDGDQVLNLFEFQLQTDLYDESEPRIIQVTPATNESEFLDLFNQGMTESICIRMTEGNYNYSVSIFNNLQEYKIMIQGGWSLGFTDYDPFSYKTTIRRGSEPARVFGIESNDGVQYVSFILDGIAITESGNLDAAVFLTHRSGESHFSFYNCDFHENIGDIDIELFGTQDNHTEIINCSIAQLTENRNGSGTGQGVVRSLISGGAVADWRVLHTTITRTTAEWWNGMAFLVRAGCELNLDLINSNLWNGESDRPYSVRFVESTGTINYSVVDCNLSPIFDAGTGLTVNNDLNVDPLFTSADPSCKTLTFVSPLKSRGADYGVANYYHQTDLGIIKAVKVNMADYIVTTTDANCGQANGSIAVEYVGYMDPSIFVPFYAQYSIDSINYQTRPFENLPAGIYPLWAESYFDGCPILLGEYTIGSSVADDFQKTTVRASCGEANGTLTITPSGNITDYTYSIDSIEFQTSNVFTDLAANYYILYYRSTADTTCVIQDFTVLNQNSDIALNLSTLEETSCGDANGKVVLDVMGADGATTFYFQGGTEQVANEFSDLEAGDYVFFVEDEKGCQDSVELNIAASTGIAITNELIRQPTCGLENGQLSIQVNDPGNLTEVLLNGDVASLIPNTNLASGTYDFQVTDADGCTATETYILDPSEPVEILDVDTVGTRCELDNGGALIAAQGAPTEYSIDGDNYFNLDTFMNLPAGTYQAYAQNENCADTISFIISESELPTLTVAMFDNTSCGEANGSVELTALNGIGPYEYILDSLTNETGLFNSLPAGEYIAYVEDLEDCRDDEEFSIAESEAVRLSAVVTDGECGELGSVELVAEGGNSDFEFSQDNEQFSTNFELKDLEEGEYIFYLRDSDGCLDTIVRQVNVYTTPELTFTTTPAKCEEAVGTLNLSATGGKGDLSYALLGEEFTTKTNYTELAEGVYTYVVQDASGCSSTSEVVITATPAVSIDNLDYEQLFCGDFLTELNFTPTGGTGTLTTNIFDSNGNEVDLNAGLPEGQYRLVITDEEDCELTEVILVRKEECTVYIPTAFDPTSSGEDRAFKIGVPAQSNFVIESFRVYDRWGNLLYDKKDIYPLTFTEWWDGTFNGRDVEQGVYVYTLELGGETSELITGSITLIR